jgi:hypothetical protein
MGRGIVSAILSLFIIAIASLRLWYLYQPKTGPVGDGEYPEYPDFAYTSMYIGIILGICCLIFGIIRIIKSNRK